MYDSQVTDRPLVMRWIPVVDQTGRTHMETCWISATATAADAPAPVGVTHAA